MQRRSQENTKAQEKSRRVTQEKSTTYNKVEQAKRGRHLVIAGNNRRPVLSFKENISIKRNLLNVYLNLIY